MNTILQLNPLQRNSDGVYSLSSDGESDFGYSDGSAVEQYLYEVFTQAQDLTSRSPELQSKIIDWPSEYHLSSDRSNLLRGFDLSGCKTVLELGSGCGAISRYLGDLGLTVDAVEGSPIRARLGRMRCRDLDNVRVINANYNELSFPEGHYDLILFVGVIEYAARFHPQASSDKDAALQVLKEAKTRLSDNGAVLVAIENRLGLKYMLGCHEDHYSKRYVGIDGYQKPAGIATYSYQEWQELSKLAEYPCHRFSFPFPDYKIPRVLLSDNYVRDNALSYNHLEGIFARDYSVPVKPSATESICWQAAADSGFLGEIANSFCVLLANDEAVLDSRQPYDFVHAPGPGRKQQYAVLTCKPSASNQVLKRPLQEVDTSGGATVDNTQIKQDTSPQNFYQGRLLSSIWLRTLLIYVRRQEFEENVRDYYEFISNQPSLFIDLLPINILVDDSGNFQVFDQEWEVEWEISKEYLLFRALLYFIVDHWILLKDFLAWMELQTVRDFVDYGFRINGLHFSQSEEAFLALEHKFQECIRPEGTKQDISQLMATAFDFSEGEDKFYTTCELQTDAGEPLIQSQEMMLSDETQILKFEFHDPGSRLLTLKIAPFDLRKRIDAGFFEIDSVAVKDTGSEQMLWQVTGNEISQSASTTINALSLKSNDNRFVSMTDFPAILVHPDLDLSQPTGRSMEVIIHLKVQGSADYQWTREHYLIQLRQFEKKQKEMEENMVYLDNLKKTLQSLEHDLETTRQEMRDIKNSKPFRLGMKIINSVNTVKKLVGK